MLPPNFPILDATVLRLPPSRSPPDGGPTAAEGGAAALPSSTLWPCPRQPRLRHRPGRRSGGACGGRGAGPEEGGVAAGSRRPGRRSDWAGSSGCAGSRRPRRQHPPPPPLFLFFPSASFFSFSFSFFFFCPVPPPPTPLLLLQRTLGPQVPERWQRRLRVHHFRAQAQVGGAVSHLAAASGPASLGVTTTQQGTRAVPGLWIWRRVCDLDFIDLIQPVL
ncbi:uncharacterized protein LOC129647315 [Bubalus kerabau]|uniref:uncharacterized protein LOC129647315 n=1 Tax=Bubalus carabanensis TaxID=3119969 RepID=UPI00244E8EF1|nr:uncharacterized protein LOC129647315 [Bubalus carabanensis]